MGAGTASEVALALKAGKLVVLLGAGEEARAFFRKLGGDAVQTAGSPTEAVETLKRVLRPAVTGSTLN